jgi:LuxR family maltose regulon positive regulatory protein
MAGALAVLEFRTAIRSGGHRAAGEVVDWLRARTGEIAEVAFMRAWAEAASGRYAAALASVAAVDDLAYGGALRVEVCLLEAEAALRDGDDAAGRVSLDSAVREGRALDLVRPFAEAGALTRAALLDTGEPVTSFGTRVVAACAAAREDTTLPVSLSERELVVLALLPSLLNAPAMAEELVVSVNTVKTHIRSIYAKLGVSTRRDAVSRAYERDLLV